MKVFPFEVLRDHYGAHATVVSSKSQIFCSSFWDGERGASRADIQHAEQRGQLHRQNRTVANRVSSQKEVQIEKCGRIHLQKGRDKKVLAAKASGHTSAQSLQVPPASRSKQQVGAGSSSPNQAQMPPQGRQSLKPQPPWQ